MLDERYIIDTPESIDLNFNIAGIGSRFLAATIDFIFLGLISVAFFIMVIVVVQIAPDIDQGGALQSVGIAIISVLNFVFYWGYFILFEMLWNGQTPGKRILRLRVVREGGHPITFAASAIRNLIRVIDFLPVLYGFGVLVMFIDRRSRRLGDFAGGTLVVKERHTISLDSLVKRAEPANISLSALQATAPTLPNLHLITRNDYDVAQDFLRRRSELSRESRVNLGSQLATKLSKRLELHSYGGSDERFIETLVQEYRQTQQDERAAATYQ